MDAIRSRGEGDIPITDNQAEALKQSLRFRVPRGDRMNTPVVTERLDYGRIGNLALISREVDQYGRVRGVDFLTYDNPGSRWDMKLNVKHGAMFQLTRRWGFGGGPGLFVNHDKSGLVAGDR